MLFLYELICGFPILFIGPFIFVELLKLSPLLLLFVKNILFVFLVWSPIEKPVFHTIYTLSPLLVGEVLIFG